MARQRTIIGLGEVVLVERPDSTEVSGLAASVAIHAVRIGHRGVVVSRIGQDAPAGELLSILEERGVDTSHVQSDPDLPTARAAVRAIGGTVARYLDSRSAFDNLQADFDLEDVAQQADAIMFGMLTRRGGQTRSEENRLVGSCQEAIKLFDLTNRAGDGLDRGHALSGLALADGAILDERALDVLKPGHGDAPFRPTVTELLQEHGLGFAIAIADPKPGAARTIQIITGDSFADGSIPDDPAAQRVAMVAILDGFMRGRTIQQTIAVAARVSDFTMKSPTANIPAELMTCEQV